VDGRVIVLGFDGGDHRTARELMDGGQMPNLQALADAGTFAPLGTTFSAESPVAWCSLNTGQDPSYTGVPGFVGRVLTRGGERVRAGGMPGPAPAHQGREDRRVADMEAPAVIALLSRHDPLVVTAAAALVTALLFFGAFKVLLRMRAPLAGVLALILGGTGGFGARVAAGYVPEVVPDIVTNPTEVPAFWDAAAEAGVPTVVLDAAMSWDRPGSENLRLLAGLGLPDSRGSNGDWFIYTTDDLEMDRPPKGRAGLTAGTVFRVDWQKDAIETQVFGPRNFCEIDRIQGEIDALDEELSDNTLGWKEGERLRTAKTALVEELEALDDERVSLPLVIRRQGEDEVVVSIDGKGQVLGEGEWSDWYHLSFELNPLIKVHAVTRVNVMSLDEPLRLFVSMLESDPADPPFWQPISSPPGYSAELARALGTPFETFGWACITMPFKDDLIDPVMFMEDIEFTLKWREGLLVDALEKGDWRLLMSVFSTPDRVQHMMYQFYDPEHPMYDEEAASRRMTFFGEEIELREAIPAIYRQVDRLIGIVREALGPDDTLLICADHGFQSFRHQFHVNNWLAEKGYLVLREGVTSAYRRSLMYVDWSRTKAYALGLGMVYLNLEGREAQGIVKPEDAPALLAQIRRELLAATDPRPEFAGRRVVDEATILGEVHHGPFAHREGDLMIGFAPTYRVSWGTTLGDIRLKRTPDGRSVPGDVFQPNNKNWSGGHVSVAPANVAGIFASNRAIAGPNGAAPHLLDIAPTVLDLLGVAVPDEMQRAPLE
jgi:predicted AlkP superfamily phosphohydrolase/phosphomutase